MKHHLGMSAVRGVLFGLGLLAAACGGEPSVASKSAAAYDEAKAKGVEVGGGHEHGGHQAVAATDHAAPTGATDAHAGHDMTGGSTSMDHAAHGATGGADHAAMGHGTTAHDPAGHGASGGAAMDHTAHRAGGGAVDHAAMGHGTSASDAHAQHGSRTTTAGAHDQHAGMQHPAPAAGADPHAQHRQTTGGTAMDHSRHGTTEPVAADPHAQHRTAGRAATAAPRTNTEIRSIHPPATLQPDAFDRPAAVSVGEAAKARQGGGHEGHTLRGITPGEDRENPPTSMPAFRDGSTGTATDHSHGSTTHPAAATVYTCPMHPEVTSDKPGTCPKCGMTLVNGRTNP